MPAPGQATQAAAAPAASNRTGANSAVVAPGATPVEKIMALMEAARPPEPAQPQRGHPPSDAHDAAQARAETPPAEAPAEPAPSDAPAPAEEPTEPQDQPDAPAAPSDAKAHEIPLDDLLEVAIDVTVKGEDGKDVVKKLTVKELRDGTMMQHDYSRKTEDVARQRKAIPEEIRKGIESETAAYYQTLQSLQDLVVSSMDAELKTADWATLSRDDPATYVRLDNRRKEIDRTLGEINQKQQEAIRKRESARAQARDEQARASWEVLEKKIPGWDAAKYQTLIKSGADAYGYKPDEVGSWVDHKAFEVLHDALEFRKMKSQTKPTVPVTQKKVVVVPKAVTPGAAAPATAARNREGEAMKQLQKRGTVQDAAAVIKARMG